MSPQNNEVNHDTIFNNKSKPFRIVNYFSIVKPFNKNRYFSPTLCNMQFWESEPKYDNYNNNFVDKTINIEDWNNLPMVYRHTMVSDINFESFAYTTMEPTNIMNSTQLLSVNFKNELLTRLQENSFKQKSNLISIMDIELSKDTFFELNEILESSNFYKMVQQYPATTYTEYYDETTIAATIYEKTLDTHNEYRISQLLCSESFHEKIKHLIVKKEKVPMVTWVTDIINGDIKTTNLPIDVPKKFNDLAYPHIEGGINKFTDSYLSSKSNILLLYSTPGMGKTTWLKQMLSYSNESCLVTYSEEIKNMDTLFAYFLTSDHKFLIIEDADNYLTARSRDSSNISNIKKLLNISDGFTSNPNKKIIFTCNLPHVDDVDPAIKRVGRCFKVLNFPKLTQQEAETYITSELGELPELFVNSGKSQYTLAEIFSYMDNIDPDTIEENSNRKFGF